MTRGHANPVLVGSDSSHPSFIPSSPLLSSSRSPSYLAERSTLCNNDMELPLPGCLFKEGLNCSRKANGHDDLVGVDVLQGLGCNVLCCAFCKNSFSRECENATLHPRQAWQWFRRGSLLFLHTAHLADLVSATSQPLESIKHSQPPPLSLPDSSAALPLISHLSAISSLQLTAL